MKKHERGRDLSKKRQNTHAPANVIFSGFKPADRNDKKGQKKQA